MQNPVLRELSPMLHPRHGLEACRELLQRLDQLS